MSVVDSASLGAMNNASDLRIFAVSGPLVEVGFDLVAGLLDCLAGSGGSLRDGDVVALAQKVVSKSEGRRVDLTTWVHRSAQALLRPTREDLFR